MVCISCVGGEFGEVTPSIWRRHSLCAHCWQLLVEHACLCFSGWVVRPWWSVVRSVVFVLTLMVFFAFLVTGPRARVARESTPVVWVVFGGEGVFGGAELGKGVAFGNLWSGTNQFSCQYSSPCVRCTQHDHLPTTAFQTSHVQREGNDTSKSPKMRQNFLDNLHHTGGRLWIWKTFYFTSIFDSSPILLASALACALSLN